MLLTVKDACELHPMALDYAMSEQIENLSDVIEKTEKDAEDFFAKNYITQGMAVLLSEGLRRLAGRSDQAVFELRQAMGGGKTHSMVALGLLARNHDLRTRVVPDIAARAPYERATVVAVNGRVGFEEHFLWGEIASQMRKAPLFAKFWKDGAKAPSERDWLDLIGDEPTLILLDELPPYFDYAVTRLVGGGTLAQVTTYALSNLLSAALKLKRCCIVLSNLSGSYEGATQQLRQAIRNFQQEANRQARAITPVELASQEIYEILRKRLFKRLPDKSVIDSVASAFAASISEAVKSKSVAKSAELIAEEIHASYPFHPFVKHVTALFRENESYRQTRGLMQFVSKMIKSAWMRPHNDTYLIGCQHLSLNVPDVREEIKRISDLQDAIAHDVASGGTAVAEVVDANLNSDAGSQVAALLLTASLSEAVESVKGLTKPQMLECLIAPNRTAIEFQDAFEAMRGSGGCWYLHRKENDAFYFSKVENLQKRIESRAETAPPPKIDAEMKRRLEAIFQPINRLAYQEVHALPKIDEIKLGGPRVALILSPDSKRPPQEAQQFWESVTEKNNFCVVTGDGSSLGSLEDKTRRIWAVARVLEETGGEKSAYKEELEGEAEQAEIEFNSTVVSLFNRVYYPTKDGLRAAKLAMTFTGNKFLAEEQIEKALADLGVSKLITSVDSHAEMLMERAETMLWPATERRVPWRDVVHRAVTNPRWLWLPPKGLDSLKTTAVGQGRWRWTDDGYVEKGPFTPPRTSVSVSERDYKEATGRATIEVIPRNAGLHGRVHYSSEPNVSLDSPVIPDTIYETDETALYFLAVDPDGQHDTGEVVPWHNRLTLTHQPRILPGKRIVELTVKPRGTIRWTTTGANPKHGTVYNGPIELPTDGDVTIFAYAEDKGISTSRNFLIPRAEQGGFVIDPSKPARLRKKLHYRGNSEAFAALNTVKGLRVRLGNVSVEIGEGARNVITRFGSETVIAPEDLEQFIATARRAIGDDTAEVKLGFGDLSFSSGHDLETFLAKLGVEIGAEEVDQ
jgi:hypothetical protein